MEEIFFLLGSLQRINWFHRHALFPTMFMDYLGCWNWKDQTFGVCHAEYHTVGADRHISRKAVEVQRKTQKGPSRKTKTNKTMGEMTKKQEESKGRGRIVRVKEGNWAFHIHWSLGLYTWFCRCKAVDIYVSAMNWIVCPCKKKFCVEDLTLTPKVMGCRDEAFGR